MEKSCDFNLQEHIDHWYNQIKQNPSLTEDDLIELKTHLLDLIDKLKRSDLDDEEAFWVASKRIDISSGYDEAYQDANNELIQVRRSLIVLTGVMAYFFFIILLILLQN